MVLSKAVFSRLGLVITLAVFFGCGYSAPSSYLNGSGGPYVTTPGNTPDVTPPTVPLGLKATPLSTTEISLTWWRSTDDRGVTGYRVYRDGVLLLTYTPGSPLPVDGGLMANVLYCYTVTALDAAGNESKQSDRSCAYTLWNSITVDTQGDFSSLALDAAGARHLSYINGIGDLMYANNASGAWSMTTIDHGAYEGTSLALDSAGGTHIAYCENGIYSLKYATNASGAWVTTTIDDNWSGPYPSLALDSAGKVHISYYDHQNGFLKYATNASGAWVTSIVDGSGWVGGYTSLAVDSGSRVHIGYYDFGNTDLKYATNASGTWVVSTIDGTGDVGEMDSLALDSFDNVHISYYDYGDRALKYASNASGAWAVTTIDTGDTAGTGWSSSIAVDGADNIHISYCDWGNSILRYATNISGNWETRVVNTGANQHTSLAVGGNGRIFISSSGDMWSGGALKLTSSP